MRSVRPAGVVALALLSSAVVAMGLVAPASAYELVPPTQLRSHHDQHGEHHLRGANNRALTGAQGSGLLTYHGGTGGIGVTTGAPKVYVVFWGSQWGAQGTDGNGNATFSNDTLGVAPRVQAFLKGVGTNGELWSGVMTQSCEGVAVGATVCPASAPHVGYPTGGALAGVRYANATAAPTTATDTQIAQVAVDTAVSFGNTTAASNRSAQYVVVSFSGLHPGGFNAPLQWCAWHDGTGGYGVTSGAGGPIAFTNLPYLTDVGGSCGASYVNSGAAGALDGVTIVEGHEYAETITDQLPSGGWYDAAGYENSDKCAWVGGPAYTNGAQNITLATGSFPVQANFSNVSNGCAITAPIFSSSSTTVTFNSTPGNQSGPIGTPVSVSAAATSSDVTKTITYSATGLPGGLTINSSTGVISGTPNAAILSSPVKVTSTTSDGAVASASFTWTVSNLAGNTVTVTAIATKSSGKGKAATQAASATDNQALQKLTWSATGLPAGVTINATTGTMSGTATTAGSYTVVAKATDLSAAFGTTTFTWNVTAPVVTNPGAQSTARRTVVSLQIVATDPGATMTYSASGLPTGLTINSTTGLISGTTSSSTATKNVSVTVRDSNAVSTVVSFQWRIV